MSEGIVKKMKRLEREGKTRAWVQKHRVTVAQPEIDRADSVGSAAPSSASEACEDDAPRERETAWEMIADGIRYLLIFTGIGIGVALAFYGCSQIQPA